MVFNCSDSMWLRAMGQIVRPHILADIGCGAELRHHVDADIVLCIEPWKDSYDLLVKDIGKDKKYIPYNYTWEESLDKIKRMDSILLMDVVEHLDKYYCYELIDRSICKITRQIVIFTPLGFFPQHIEGYPMQEHVSGWFPDEFGSDWDVFINDHFINPGTGAFFAIYDKLSI